MRILVTGAATWTDMLACGANLRGFPIHARSLPAIAQAPMRATQHAAGHGLGAEHGVT